MNTFNLHAIVEDAGAGLLEASLIEFNITVAGRNDQELVSEFARVIETHYEIAKDKHLVPFVDLCRPPSGGILLMPNLFQDMGAIPLRDEVAQALASVVHAPRFDGLHVRGLKKAA